LTPGRARVKTTAILIAAATAALAGAALAQAPARPPAAAGAPAAPGARPAAPAENPQRAPLLWKEEWKQNADGKEGPLNLTGSVGNPDLELKLYGAGAKLNMLGKNGDDGNPAHVFSGESTSQMAFAFHSKKGSADLSGLSRIRVNTKMS